MFKKLGQSGPLKFTPNILSLSTQLGVQTLDYLKWIILWREIGPEAQSLCNLQTMWVLASFVYVYEKKKTRFSFPASVIGLWRSNEWKIFHDCGSLTVHTHTHTHVYIVFMWIVRSSFYKHSLTLHDTNILEKWLFTLYNHLWCKVRLLKRCMYASALFRIVFIRFPQRLG